MARGIEIILVGADDSVYRIHRSLPLYPDSPKETKCSFHVDLAESPMGFLMPPMTGIVEDKQSSYQLERCIQRVEVGKRKLTLQLNVLPECDDVAFFYVKHKLERAFTFQTDKNDPDSHLARLIVRSGDTDKPEELQSRYIEVSLEKPVEWSEKFDNVNSDGWVAVVSLYGSPFWMETKPRTAYALSAQFEKKNARLTVIVENPGDVAVPLTWTFEGIKGKGAGASYSIPDVKLIGGRFNRVIDTRQRLLTTPMVRNDESVEVSSDRDRPPIMSSKGKERSRELLTLSHGTYLRNKLPEYTQEIPLGVSYQKSGGLNIPPKTIKCEWTPMYYGAW